jgi:hypothetical protein
LVSKIKAKAIYLRSKQIRKVSGWSNSKGEQYRIPNKARKVAIKKQVFDGLQRAKK